jgi:hypothetical protein
MKNSNALFIIFLIFFISTFFTEDVQLHICFIICMAINIVGYFIVKQLEENKNT